MIHLDYRSRIVFFNMLLYTITLAAVCFAAVQGLWYQSSARMEHRLEEGANNAQRYIDQALYLKPASTSGSDWFIENASRLDQIFSRYGDGTTLILSADRTVLKGSSQVMLPSDMIAQEVAASSKDTRAVGVRTYNRANFFVLFTPLTDAHSRTIGYVGWIASLQSLEKLCTYVCSAILLCGIAGFIILFGLIQDYASKLIRPIKDLTRISKEIDDGNYNVTIDYKRDDEIGELTEVYNAMTANINNVIGQLTAERERLGSVLASLDDGLLALDGEGNVIASNLLISTYFGVDNPKTIYDFTYQSFIRDIYDSLKQNQNYVSEEVESNGKILLLTGSPMYQADFEENYLIIIRNITQSRQLEREQKKFISSVSHELRTPMTTIIGYTDMLMRRQVEDKNLLNTSLTTINKEGHRLVRLVDDLLASSKLDNNLEFTVRRTTLDLEHLLLDVVDQMRIKGWQKEIEISFKAEQDIPNILGDYDRLSQMFINILHNAIKYSDRGGLIDVILTKEGNEVAAAVRDYGTGIDEDQQQLIFSAFYRIEEDRARNEGEGGAGLGLYLVKQIAEKHNGRIEIDSQVGEGTNVTIFLPAILKADQEEPDA